ncbi:hypothetical protein [Burkholderia vietnamiensis]|uniref:hypothetical protein n=1 Tax=Burkholderia vietnamiensis TaxID=60552 RepID=UPI000AB24676|nr:hypothetical protein [Burkholderia vietnamiensis]
MTAVAVSETAPTASGIVILDLASIDDRYLECLAAESKSLCKLGLSDDNSCKLFQIAAFLKSSDVAGISE